MTSRTSGQDNTLAVIVAAGSGSRFGAELPKQFCPMAGRPVLMHTIDAFRNALPDSRIILVLSHSAMDLWQTLCREYGFESPEIVAGGASRAESVANALEAAAPLTDSTVVMIHDGARPMASPEMLHRLRLAVTSVSPAVVPVVAVTDSLRHISSDGSSNSVERSQFRAVQTPQCFLGGILSEAYSKASGIGFERFTDDASVVETAAKTKITLIDGDPHNIKITTPGDIEIAETLMKRLCYPCGASKPNSSKE